MADRTFGYDELDVLLTEERLGEDPRDDVRGDVVRAVGCDREADLGDVAVDLDRADVADDDALELDVATEVELVAGGLRLESDRDAVLPPHRLVVDAHGEHDDDREDEHFEERVDDVLRR